MRRPFRTRQLTESAAGMALIGVMLLLMVLSVAISALSVSGRTEITISLKRESSAQAQAAAEAGLNHAIAASLPAINGWEAAGLPNPSAAATNMLLGPDGLSGTEDFDADNGSLEGLGIPRPPARLPVPGTANTQYVARLFDEDDPARGLALTAAEQANVGEDGVATNDANSMLAIQATGFGPDDAAFTVEAMIAPMALPAIVSNDDLTVQGTVSIVGLNGSIHANGDLELLGSPTVTASATASGGYTASGTPVVGGMQGGGRPVLPVPPIHAIDFRPQADFILQSTGIMIDQAGNVICDASGNGRACQNAGYMWEFRRGRGWDLSDNVLSPLANHRTYYVETDVSIGSSVGDAVNPLNVSVIAEGSIDVSGSPTIEANTPELLFVTDGDLQITGDLTQVGDEARFLVHEQLQISGNATLKGQMMIEDAAEASRLVITTRFFSGNVSISNNNTMMRRVFGVVGWREQR